MYYRQALVQDSYIYKQKKGIILIKRNMRKREAVQTGGRQTGKQDY